MSRTKRYLGGISFGYANQLLATLVSLWLTPFLLSRIGQHDYGLWLVGTQVMFYLGLLDLGIVALLPRETAFATGRASETKASEVAIIVGQAARIVLWQWPLVALAALIAWFIMPADWEALRQPISVVLITYVLMFPLRIFSAVLQGLQDLAFLGRIGIISYLAGTAITVSLIFAGHGLYALAIGWAALQIILAGAGWYRLRTHFPGVLPDRLPKLGWSSARRYFKQGFWVSLNQIASVLLVGTDIIIIGKIFGPAAVVPYACTGKLISLLSNQPQILILSAGPALSQMKVSEARERVSQVCLALSQATLMLSGAAVCVVLAVNQSFISRWVGAEQYSGFGLTALLLLTMLLRHWNLTLAYSLFCFGQERRLALTSLLDGLVTVSGIYLFAQFWGPIGAPLGAITGVCLVSLPANLSVLARENGVSRVSAVSPLLSWGWRFLILALGAGVLAKHWVSNSILSIALTTSIVALIYCLVMLPIVFRPPLGIYLRPRLAPIGVRLFRALRLSNPA